MDCFEDVEDSHKLACSEGKEAYIDPNSGLMVFTELAHKKRGRCCGSSCRHCPYDHMNVPKSEKSTLSEKQIRISNLLSNSRQLDENPSRVYTRTGDGGTSQLFSGERRTKDDAVFEALGAIDELSSFIGVARVECLLQGCADLSHDLELMLSELLDIGSKIATPPRHHGPSPSSKAKESNPLDQGMNSQNERTVVKNNQIMRRKKTFKEKLTDCNQELVLAVQRLEDRINEMSDSLPKLASFILPSGGRASVALQVSRSVCRRAERRIVTLQSKLEEEDDYVPIYINRLSDYLFVAARWAAHHDGSSDIEYKRSSMRPQHPFFSSPSVHTNAQHAQENQNTNKQETSFWEHGPEWFSVLSKMKNKQAVVWVGVLASFSTLTLRCLFLKLKQK